MPLVFLEKQCKCHLLLLVLTCYLTPRSCDSIVNIVQHINHSDE